MKSFGLLLLLLIPAPIRASQDLLPELVRRIKPSAVAIETFDSRGETLTRGSGFFVDVDRVARRRKVIVMRAVMSQRARSPLLSVGAGPVRPGRHVRPRMSWVMIQRVGCGG